MATAAQAATRQQLDELDALLQKMLDQPGSSAGSNSPPPAPPNKLANNTVAYGIPPAAAFAAESPAVAPKPNLSTQNNRPASWGIDLNPKSGSSVLGRLSPAAEAFPRETPISTFGPVAPLSVTPIPVTAAPPTVARQNDRMPISQWPLVAINSSFDAVVSALPLGNLITHEATRNVLGYAGVSMIVASVVMWFMAQSGWSW